MERNLYDDDDLEDFLKQKADQYRIYPSDRVWTNVYTALHTGRKWHIIGGMILLLGLLTLISLEKGIPSQKDIVKKEEKTVTPAIYITAEKKNTEAIFTTDKSNTKKLYKPITNQQIEKTVASRAISTNKIFTLLSKTSPIAANTATISRKPANKIVQETIEEKNINWLEEKVINKLSAAKKKYVRWQFYITPTISYRTLQSGSLNSNSQSRILAAGGFKGLVDQAPALGVELGTALQFPIKANFMLKTGMQLNYVRYTINAYRASPEKTSITLTGTGYYTPPTTITTYSTHRTFNDGIPETIQNQYVQLSLPVGAEWMVLGGKRLQLNLAGSVQPTYLLTNSAYMLTSDLTNYAKEPALVRRWNVNAGIETFVSYKSGSLRWQIGPQFRYQFLSSYTDRYSIREHLMEYGMKIGVSKTLR